MANWKTAAVLATLLAVVLTQTSAQPLATKKEDQPAAGKTTDSPKKPATHKVEKKPFKIELSVKGMLSAEEASEIAYRPFPIVGLPYSHGPMTIRKVTAHGTKVKKGDLLVSLDTRKIDQAIKQVEADIRSLEAGIQLAEKEQPLLEKGLPVEIEAAQRGKREADEDLDFFRKTGRPEMEKRARTMVKFAAFYYEYTKEQLRQLEKMYKANDLTEDTEKIILKRQRFMVEESANELRVAELELDYVLKTTLPRRDTVLREGVAKQVLALEKAKTTLAPALRQKEESLAKMRFERDRLAAGLELLQIDRATMTIEAPADGVVYYGKFEAGHWDHSSTLAGKLVEGGTIMPDDVFMSVVKARPLLVRLAIEEKDVHLVKPGLEGKARMVFHPDVKLPARVTKLSAVPTAPGKFEAVVALVIDDRADLVPGMACTVRFVPYAKKEAFVVPASTVVEDDDQHFVEVCEGGKCVRRTVTAGRSHDGQIEILEGLRAGEEIRLEPDGGKKSAP